MNRITSTFFTLLFALCCNFGYSQINNISSLNKETDLLILNQFEGKFKLFENSDTNLPRPAEPIWIHFKPFKEMKQYDRETDYFTSKLISKNKIKFDLVQNEKVIKSKVFRFKLKGNVLLCKNNFICYGIPLVLFVYRREKLEFQISKDGNLLLQIKGKVVGGLCILMTGDFLGGQYTFVRM